MKLPKIVYVHAQFDALIEQIDSLATKLGEQALSLDQNLRRLQGALATLKYQLSIYKLPDEPDLH